ncbi:hypothetical protein J3D55_000189 [Chryseobacterium ginsenosidimutans]|uniref:alpha/beta fold hydrolase n=1 Tax=Chryseobacterium ginsenosidimutans TaxID=687846 RepID=UPI002168F2AD|nr:alpha/beta hydrolase [Chryseobacterium ginsenosidimutans]MCS3867273.1 hypothetical protein [Chryseobacterium ginsenosidimutans]
MLTQSNQQQIYFIKKYIISAILILIFNMGLNAQETKSSLGTLKQIDAGFLNIGYTEAGSPSGTPVILLHGWPYDIHSYEDVVPMLTAKGYRVITPYLRGFGTTRFLSDKTMRNGQQAAVASDIIALMNALKIDKAIVGGFDWGARNCRCDGCTLARKSKRSGFCERLFDYQS